MIPVPVLFTTANVGSVFEEPESMLKLWMSEFLAVISRLKPKFIAVHCQEVGGKNFEQSMKYVQDFIDLLIESEELVEFSSTRIFIDEDYSTLESFTALGSLYFIHYSLDDVCIWDFEELKFVAVSEKKQYKGSLDDVTIKEKAKFPVDFFPECKWSRKGFLRTRWRIGNIMFDLVNIHLFHDASNFIAVESFPSVYTNNRRRALEYSLERFSNDQYDNAPLFIFGDFNFRLDTQGVVQSLTKGLTPVQTQQENDKKETYIQYLDGTDKVVLTLGNKEFAHADCSSVFLKDGGHWLKEFDRELEVFSEQLFEYDKKFPPSYPYEENLEYPEKYMRTRCPAWCDRVVMSRDAFSLIKSCDDIEYSVIGATVCMGDHKPVYLKCSLEKDAGISTFPTPSPTPPINRRMIQRSHSELSERLTNVLCLQRDAQPKPAESVIPPTIITHSSLRNMLLIKQACEKTTSLPINLSGQALPLSVKRHNSMSLGEDLHCRQIDCSHCVHDTTTLKCALCRALESELHGLERKESFGSKGRLRVNSSSQRNRYMSHHSSSSEDWFEEIESEEEKCGGSDTGFSEGATASWSMNSHEKNSLLNETPPAQHDSDNQSRWLKCFPCFK